MRSSPLRLGLGLAFGLGLSASLAAAQTPPNLGAAHVLGLRAPDGDDEIASQLSVQLRVAARAVGYEVPDNSPAMEQEMAVTGCSSTGPDCLHMVAEDIHATKLIYGSVTRIGRGRNASLNVEISLWDEASRREVHRVSRVLTRAQATNAAELREVAIRALTEIAQHDRPAPANHATPSSTPTSASRRSRCSRSSSSARFPPRTPVLRYIGFGALGLGGAVAIVGVVQAIISSGQSSSATESTPLSAEPYGAWSRFQANENYNRTLSASQVCDLAQQRSGADAGQVRDLCSSNSSARSLALGLGIGGAVLAVAGAVLIVVDRPRVETPAPPQPLPASARSPACGRSSAPPTACRYLPRLANASSRTPLACASSTEPGAAVIFLGPPRGAETRPTSDRVREAVFNIVSSRVDGARVLDLFAGTGALGIEALSRGAAHVTFVECDRGLCQTVETNLQELECDPGLYSVLLRDVRRALKRGGGPYDLVFIDPPYGHHLEREALAALVAPDLLGLAALVVVEHASRRPRARARGVAAALELLTPAPTVTPP